MINYARIHVLIEFLQNNDKQATNILEICFKSQFD